MVVTASSHRQLDWIDHEAASAHGMTDTEFAAHYFGPQGTQYSNVY